MAVLHQDCYRTHGRLKPSQNCSHNTAQQCSILIYGHRITSQYDESIRFHVIGYHLRIYIQERQDWTNKIWDEVDFYLFGRHFRRLLKSSNKATWMKIVHDQRPLGVRRYRQAAIPENSLHHCPSCKKDDETALHFCTVCFESSSTDKPEASSSFDDR
jgi:hypothetical protein